jgi:hypothetical protein
MTDRPIIFSAPMVRALLDGRKTQTRRLAWRESVCPGGAVNDGGGQMDYIEPSIVRRPSPWQRVQPGDRLWVREAWRLDDYADRQAIYRCNPDWPQDVQDAADLVRWRPSIHMPRWASRITLTVTAVRVQRLHGISEDDARAEGCWTEDAVGLAAHREQVPLTAVHPSMVFWQLWDDLHGEGAWRANPEVVAITFTVARRNIDACEAAHA